MEKKLALILLILALVIGVIDIYYFFYKETPYSDNPENWVLETPTTKLISIEDATKGESYIDSVGEQQYKNIGTMFSTTGYYQNVAFDKEYISSSGTIFMRITNNMTPNDGVIEGILFERVEDDKLFAYAIVDEDWKKNLPNTIFRWGEFLQNTKNYEFKEISDGVYLDKVEDDPNRFLLGLGMHQGGVQLGVFGEKNTLIFLN
ncbi:hypothetical protein GOV05_01440 [Candidatus Woesearchaeota archaeon]|nr:hypothetical protein [Candidatus Woesearchaeota archaeon]